MNTISTRAYRDKYRLAQLDRALRNAMVAEKVCAVDRSPIKTIQNPFGSQPTALVQALAGTYSVSSWTLTDENLDVNDEVIYAEHIFDCEELLPRSNLFASRTNEISYAIAIATDKWVVNNLTEDGTGAYTTPVGGFTTPSNIITILANLSSKVGGFSDVTMTGNNLYLIIENTDMVGFTVAQATNGFVAADRGLGNGFMGHMMGIDIYVVRTGTFVDESTTTVSGTKTWTNSGHRVFGVKNTTTWASPRRIKFEEKPVTGKTGKEFVYYGYTGFKAWSQKATLTIDITLA